MNPIPTTGAHRRLPRTGLGLARRLVLGSGAAGAVLFAFLVQTQPSFIEALDYRLHDTLIRWQARPPDTERVIIVDVDESSLRGVGQWPWPRYRLGALVKALAAARPAVIGFDILFPEPDRASLTVLKNAFHREFNLDLGFTGIPPGLEDNDGYFGHVLSQANTVGAFFFYFDRHGTEATCPLTPLEIPGQTAELEIPTATGILCNVDPVQGGYVGCGFINNQKDADGLVRRLPLLITQNGRLYPGFSLAMLMAATGRPALRLETDAYGPVLMIGETRLPLDRQGGFWLRFPPRPRSHRFISAMDVLAGRFDPSLLTGRLVLVGSTAVGLNDLHYTPVGPEFSGTEAHAVMLDNALSGATIRKPVWTPLYAWLATLLAGLAVPLFFAFGGPLAAAAGTLGVIVVFPGASFALFSNNGLFIPSAGPVLVAMIEFAGLSILLYARERRLAFMRLKQLLRVQQLTIEAMAAVAETRDTESGAHIKRTQHYVQILADHLRLTKADAQLTPDYVELLFHCAPLHDVGKVGVPDRILCKEGKLTPDEFEIMKLHTMYGRQVIMAATQGQREHEFLHLATEIALSHHEHWDGTGYPQGLSGTGIPLSARIMAVADVYDALISRRRYKQAFSHQKAREIIVEGQGTHFDPVMVKAFLAVEEKFRHIAKRFEDEPPRPGTASCAPGNT